MLTLNHDRYVHPLLSTVTYIETGELDMGPTVVLPHHAAEDGLGRLVPGSSHSTAFVAFPERGKHVCFEGNLLHGVPMEFQAIDASAHQVVDAKFRHKKKKTRHDPVAAAG